MKTSNKILLGLISVIGLTMLTILIYAKSSLLHFESKGVHGDGVIIQKVHDIGEISFFKSNYNYEVYVKKGDAKLMIETDENLHEFLKPEVFENENNLQSLQIVKPEDVSLNSNRPIKVFLTTPSLERVDLSSFSRVIFEDTMFVDEFTARLNGSSELKLKVKTDKLNVKSNGHSQAFIKGEVGDVEIDVNASSVVELESINASVVDVKATAHSNVKLVGQTNQLNVNLNASSNLMAERLKAKNVDVSANAHASATVFAEEILDVKASASSSISYKGRPQIKQQLSSHASLNNLDF